MIRGDEVQINGTGETSRDFCYVANVVQANLLAATTTRKEALGEAYNIACRRPHDAAPAVRGAALPARERHHPRLADARPVHGPFRAGDVMHSLADIGKARSLLGYEPTHTLDQGLDEAIGWYVENLS